MKKLFVLSLSLLAASFVVLGCAKKSAEDKSLENVKAKGYFVLGLDDSFPPMGFREEKTNEIVGFDIDLAKEAAKRIGVKVQLKPVDWDGVIFSLYKGDIDVIWNGLTITPEREAKIAFSTPYLDNKQIIVVTAKSKIAAKKDLKGMIVGLQLGSSSETALTNDALTASTIKEIKKYQNNTLALMDLAAGRTDAVVVDEIVGRYYIAKKPGVYKILEENFGSETYGVGMRKEDKSFIEAINKALEEMKKDGTADAISKKWFGEAIMKK